MDTCRDSGIRAMVYVAVIALCQALELAHLSFQQQIVIWGKTIAWKHASSLKAIDWPSPSPPSSSSSSSSPRVFDVLVHDAQMLLCSTLSLSPCAAQEKKETVKTNYSLSDTVFAKAELNCDGRVCIWLGVSPNGSAVEHQSGTSLYH